LRGSTLQSKKAKPKTTINPTAAMIPVIVGSSVLLLAGFESWAEDKSKNSKKAKLDNPNLSMMMVESERVL
jgi:hypothetical protein